MRRIRKLTLYVCTTCLKTYNDSKQAKQCANTHPLPPKEKHQRDTQTGKVLQAVRNGAETAEAVSRKAKLPLERVHSLLSYHRRRGAIRGGSGKLKAL